MADMKAWKVSYKNECYSTVVFAETRGKARSIAMRTECCEDVPFCDIDVCRMPQADKCYKAGKTEMDWFDPEDRLVLVRDCGYSCDPDCFDPEYCASCSAKDFCGEYEQWMESEDDGA